MKQITIISGKGGTGKTSFTAALGSIVKDAVWADCDVDAADLHLIFKPDIKKTMGFHGLKIASINKDLCTDCKKCFENCAFNAITEDITLVKEKCEGCSVCSYVCPVDAIEMIPRDSGFSYISDTRFGPMSHAFLKTAEEASGKLVTVVRENARKIAVEQNKELIIIDGPPGIGCPVISAITGVDMVAIVTEPTLSAINDLKRIYDVSKHFKIPAVVIINKYDVNLENTEKINIFCKNNNIPIAGKIPYDTIITKAMVEEKNIFEIEQNIISENIELIWKDIKKRLLDE